MDRRRRQTRLTWAVAQRRRQKDKAHFDIASLPHCLIASLPHCLIERGRE